MINKRFDTIDTADIEALVANAVGERKTIEYKEELPSSQDKAKKEFLADVSSFANAAGGDIIYGVREHRDSDGQATGIPEAIVGLASINMDQEKLRLESLIRDGIAPRINGVQIGAPSGEFGTNPVLIVRVPKSWASPHMVTFKNDSKFYSRTSAGKYPLDVTEIRSAFALSETLAEKIRRFRDERLGRIIADETPVPLEAGPRAVLHLIPASSVSLGAAEAFAAFANRPAQMRLLHGSGYDQRLNFDGLLFFDAHPPQLSRGYMQIFRNFMLEAVDSDIVGGSRSLQAEKLIPSAIFESGLIDSTQRYLKLLKDWVVNPPVFILLSILGVKGYAMASSDRVMKILYGQHYAIDRDNLLLPDILVEDLDGDASLLLKPALDAFWQSAGWEGSPNYRDGKWTRLYG